MPREETSSVPIKKRLVNERVLSIVPSATLALTQKAKELKAQGKPVVSLAAGEPDFAMPAIAREALVEAMRKGLTRYTPTTGTRELKEAIQKKMERDQGLRVGLEHIAVSCGAKHSLYNILQVLIEPGDEVLIPCPYWVSYPEMIKLAGGIPVLVPTEENDFLMTRDLIEGAITPRTRAVILNSPSNPTGAVLKEGQLRDIAKLLVERDLYALSDEIYEYYTFDGVKHASVATFLDDFFKHVAIVNGASKSYAMTGLRIGYAVAAEPLIRGISVLQDHSTSNPASLSQEAALASLGMDGRYREDLRRVFQEKRDLMLGLLRSVKGLQAFKPEGAFYCFVSIEGTGLSPEVFSRRLLEEKFVATIPGEGFGSKSHVRMSFAASEEDIKEGCQRIRDWLS